ncbi:polysaccharide deacetylase [Sinobacterium caligoides]|uniref:Polysaccharide deacetylase n=1 Tax=Sinobacterium caligoides TaxID=933926 RepID=A0A3N2DNY0_9GAMM|nr:polysaccharide deacetylase family protein [Sinobacterium caligoides]ROS01513.1 polysaccharide deacetylase [Sinobacterium caligoides]
MICLTTDVHHAGLKTGNQQHAYHSECRIAAAYAQRLQEVGVKATFFFTGRCFHDEWADIRSICQSPLVEIAGHNYSALTPVWWHRICQKLCNSYNGPQWYQRRDAMRTIEIIERYTGYRIESWRNHMYMHGPHTEQVLADCGLKSCCDGVSRQGRGMYWQREGIYNFPINIMPDHEHLYHAERTEQWVEQWQQRYQWRDDYGTESYYIDEWTDKVLEELSMREANGELSHLIIHPITLHLCDRLKRFEDILAFIAQCETVWVREVRAMSEQQRLNSRMLH